MRAAIPYAVMAVASYYTKHGYTLLRMVYYTVLTSPLTKHTRVERLYDERRAVDFFCLFGK